MNSEKTQSAERIWPVLLSALAAAVIFAAAYKLGQPMLMAAAGFSILIGLFAWSQPFIICALFIAFSYFRIPEAYPSLEPMKPALLLGALAVVLVGLKALLTPLPNTKNAPALKAHCLFWLAACIGTAIPFSFLRSGGTIGLDPLLIPIVMITAAISIVVWSMLLSASGKHPLPVNMQLFTAFFVVICITIVFSRVPGDSFDWWTTITWKITAMTLATAWLVRTDRDLLLASNIMIGSGLLIAFVVFYNKIYGLSLVQQTRVTIGRIESEDIEAVKAAAKKILSDPNDLALILMFPLAFALARVVHRRSFAEAALGVSVCLTILTAIVFTQSRGAAIGVLVVFAMLLLQRYRSAILGLLAIVIAAPLIIGAMNLAQRDSSGYGEISRGSLDESAAHRIEAWQTAIYMAASNPLTGVGISNFPQMYYSYTSHWRNRQIAVHSMWFQVLGEIGLIGFVLFVAMIWTSFKINSETIRRLEQARAPPFLQATAAGLQAGLAGTCASGTFLSQAYTWPVYIIIALIAALANQTKEYRLPK